MSYPSGPPGGYPGQSPQQGGQVFGQPPAAPNPLGKLGMPALLSLLILVLSLVAYFCSFGGGSGIEVMTLLAGGLLAGLGLLPKGPNVLPFVTVLSLVGGLTMLSTVINSSSGGVPTSYILILVFGLVQAAVSVVALLLEYGIVKLAPRPAVPHSTSPAAYPPSGSFAQQQPQGQGQQPPSNQATTYMQPAPQSTQFLQQPGQLNHPHNPPGGPGTE